jgi:hypothetical protein
MAKKAGNGRGRGRGQGQGKVSGTIGKIAVPIVESDRSPSLVTEGSLEPEVFDDAIDPEGSELENRVDKLDMEIDQQEDFDEDSFAEQGNDQKEDFGDDSFAEQGIEQNDGFVAEEMVYHSAREEEIPIHDGPNDPLRWGIGRICSNPIELWVLFNILNLRRMGVKLVFSCLMLLLRKVL